MYNDQVTKMNLNDKIGKIVRRFREEAGLSQEELADKLDLQRPGVTQIEAGDRKLTPEELVKISAALNVSVNVLLGMEEPPEVSLPSGKAEDKPKGGMRISIPHKNLAKFREVLLYILNKVGSKPNVGETVLYKLLYFIDFNYYEKYEEQLIGATYIKNHFGPTPVEFAAVVRDMVAKGEIEAVKTKYFNREMRKYLPVRTPDLSKLSALEMATIDDVLNKLSDMRAVEISRYSHDDVPWRTTPEEKPIDYESVFYRTAAYSVRKDADESEAPGV